MMKEIYYDWNDVANFSRQVRTWLPKQLGGRPDTVVGILNGGAIPALIVANYFDVPLVWTKAKSYTGQHKGKVEVSVDGDSRDIEGKRILLIDDIIDTGETVATVYEKLRLVGTPAKVVVVAMVSKLPELREKTFNLDFVHMFEAPKESWVIFPWE